MNIYTIILIIIAVVTFGFNLYLNHNKNKILDELSRLIAQKKFKEYESRLDSPEVQRYFPSFNLKYMRLSAAVLQGHHDQIKKGYLSLLEEKMTEKQKNEVYIKGFNYFLSVEDYEMCEKFHDLVMTLKNQNAKREIERVYDIMVLKGDKYLDALLDENEKMDERARGINEYLISLIYENQGNIELAKKYKKLSEKHMDLFNKEVEKQNA